MNLLALAPRVGRAVLLLVEDEGSIATPFSRALWREGFEPVIASTLSQAWAFLKEHEPDLVLLPDGDGRELAGELRASSRVPIIMLTARGSEVDRAVGLELGVDDYIVKPFATADVIARIRAVVRHTHPAHSQAKKPSPAADSNR